MKILEQNVVENEKIARISAPVCPSSPDKKIAPLPGRVKIT
ncbi:hypothetical protein [Fibrobacter sp. UWT3]|nr:hypothetical protein [Fibrobacter sp. UWT3]